MIYNDFFLPTVVQLAQYAALFAYVLWFQQWKEEYHERYTH